MKPATLAPFCAPALLAIGQGADAQSALDRAATALLVPRGPSPSQAIDRPTTAVVHPATNDPDTAAMPGILVQAVMVVGLNNLAAAELDDATIAYVGKPLSPTALKSLANAVTGRVRALGYPLATTRIPQQTLSGGVLRVEVDEGRIDEVRIQGDRDAATVAALGPIASDGSVRRDRLERDLLLAGDLPGVTLGDARLRHEHGRSVLVVDARDQRIEGAVGIANDGMKSGGPLRTTAELDVNHILGPDRLTLFALTVPDAPRELSVGYARYVTRVGASGLDLGVEGSVSRARPSGLLESVDTRGRAWRAAVDASYPFVRRRGTSLWGSISIEIEEARQRQLDYLVRLDRTPVIRTGLSGFTQFIGGRVRASATVSQGLATWDATPLGDPRGSRDAASPRFTKLNLTATGSWKLAGPLSVAAAIDTQLASGPLLIGEQMGLGGARILRGYDYSERTGDEGTAASLEARLKLADKPVRTALYTFADAGRVRDTRAAGGASATLASAGGGIRVTLFGIALDAAVAVPLKGPRYESGSRRARVQFAISRHL